MAKDILVLGGGFAGLAAVRELVRRRRRGADIRIRLVDKMFHSIFYPLLPALVSGMVRPEHLVYPFRPFCRRHGVLFLQAEVKEIRLDAGQVVTSAGTLAYDGLIIALGCETNYFGRGELRAKTFSIHTVRSALEIAREATTLVENVEIGGDPEGRAHVLIVGGGYSGFEVAGEIAELIHARTMHPYARLRELIDIAILEINDRVLPHSSDKIREWVVAMARQYDIRVATRTTVREFPGDRTVVLSDGQLLRNAMIIWTPGVAPGPVCANLDVPKIRGGLLAVDAHLAVPGHPGAFAAGDVAGAVPPGRGEPLYMAVQFALCGGRTAARNAIRSLRGAPLEIFDPRDLGYVVPMAPGEGVGRILGREVRGKLPYWLHFVMSTARSWGGANKREVVYDFLFKRRMTEYEQRRRTASYY